MIVNVHGLEVNLPARWDGRVFQLPDTGPTVHAGNFSVPTVGEGFGGAAVDAMRPGNIFVALVEYIGINPSETIAFAPKGIPDMSQTTPGDFLDNLQQGRIRAGFAGLQRAFSVGPRCFVLYSVLYRQPSLDGAAVTEFRGVVGSLKVDASYQPTQARVL